MAGHSTARNKDGHGPLHLEQAIAKSCNIFFYELGRRLGISKIAEHAQALGSGLADRHRSAGRARGSHAQPGMENESAPVQMVCGRDDIRFDRAGRCEHDADADAPRRERHGDRWPAHDSACAVARRRQPGRILRNGPCAGFPSARRMRAESGRECGRASITGGRGTMPQFPAWISAAKPAPSRSSAMKGSGNQAKTLRIIPGSQALPAGIILK